MTIDTPKIVTRVIIESPFASADPYGLVANVQYAERALKDSLMRGEAPFASHITYTRVLDDTDPESRARGIDAGLAWGEVADLTAVYLDRGFSKGMRYGVKHAHKFNRRVVLRVLDTTLESVFAKLDEEDRALLQKGNCRHTKVVSFDVEAARGLDAREVRRRWPRFDGTCPDCGFTGIIYACVEQYIMGDY